jgi:hypothetical protein
MDAIRSHYRFLKMMGQSPVKNLTEEKECMEQVKMSVVSNI